MAILIMMRILAKKIRTVLAPILPVLVTLAIVISLLPFAAHYGETNGLPQRAERWAAAYAERREAAKARRLAAAHARAEAAGAVMDDPVADELALSTAPDGEAVNETLIELDAPAAGPREDAPAEDPREAAPTIDLVAAAMDGPTTDIEALLTAAPVQNGWFPTAYRPDDGTFVYPDVVELLGQLHIAHQRAQAGVPAPDFTEHVKALFIRDGKLFAAYDLANSLPVTAAEDPAAYRRAFEYALTAREHEWAAAVRAHLQNRDWSEHDAP